MLVLFVRLGLSLGSNFICKGFRKAQQTKFNPPLVWIESSNESQEGGFSAGLRLSHFEWQEIGCWTIDVGVSEGGAGLDPVDTLSAGGSSADGRTRFPDPD